MKVCKRNKKSKLSTATVCGKRDGEKSYRWSAVTCEACRLGIMQETIRRLEQ